VKRADTSMVFTIAVMVFALSFVWRAYPGQIRPALLFPGGRELVSLGFYLCSYTTSLTYLFICFGVIGVWVMASLCHTDTGNGQVVPRQARLGGWPGGGRVRRRLGDFGPLSQLKLIPSYGLRLRSGSLAPFSLS